MLNLRSASHLGRPMAIEPAAMRSMLTRAADEDRSFEAIAREWGDYLEDSWDGTVHDGVAVIPVGGVLMRQPSWWGLFSGSSAYEILIRDINAAVRNPAVSAIILDIDSPGGEVTGVAELADAIRAMSGEKPIYAYGTGTVASAAYWIASACDEIVVSATSAVGSIGVMATVTDYTEAYAKAGIKQYRFISSQSPGKNAEPGTDAGDAAIQAEVDALAEVFVSSVAKFRRASNADVLANYGKGGVLVGQAAVDAGLADAVGSLEGLIAGLRQSSELGAPAVNGGNEMGLLKTATNKSRKIAAKARATEDEEEIAEDEEDVVDAVEDDEDATSEDEDETTAEGDETDDEDVTSEDEDEEEIAEDDEEGKPAAKGEKARIAAILGHAEAKGRRKLAEHLALGTDLSVKAAAGILKASPRATGKTAAKGNGFDARMRAQGNVSIGSAKGSAGKSKDSDATAAILATAKLIGMQVK